MIIAKTISSLPDIKGEVCLAVGTFDGVHLGHVELIKEMNNIGTSLVFTFSNHPTEVLEGVKSVPALTTPDYKTSLLDKAGAEYCVIQPFTDDISKMPYNLFLEEIYSAIPFSHLFFGENDTIGKDRRGSPAKVSALGQLLGFKAHYLSKVKMKEHTISSSRIRNALSEGNLALAQKMLGRPYTAKILISEPYLDQGLLKAGKYNVEFPSHSLSSPSTVHVDEDGILIFDKIPNHLQNFETEIIQFNEAI